MADRLLAGRTSNTVRPANLPEWYLSLTLLLSLIDLKAVHKERDNHVVSTRHSPRLVSILNKIT